MLENMSECTHETCMCEESYYELDSRLGQLEDRVDDRIDIEIEDLKIKMKELKRQNKFILKLLKRVFIQLDLKEEDLK